VWDGDQVLLEIQAPGATGTSSTNMEKDVGLAPVIDTTSLVLPKYLADSAGLATNETLARRSRWCATSTAT
jgi:hypothetical protein